jgi:hypothetical protein
MQASGETCNPIPTPLTFRKLEKHLEECKISRIEQLLSLLPLDFRSRFVLVHSSRSLQGASASHPRVILFGLDARFILAFSGSPELEGYDTLETIEFNDHTKKFQFRTITFPSEQESVKGEQKPVVSGLDPPKCATCHRKELRPNWDTYPAWPGVYGSVDDGMPAAEKEAYAGFMEQIYLKVGRYRYFENPKEYPDGSHYYDYFPNSRRNLQFSFLLSLLNSQAIARSIKENPRLHPFRYALLASLGCRDDFIDSRALQQLIPDSITSKSQKSYQEIQEEVTERIRNSHETREDRQMAILSAMNGNIPVAEWEHFFKPRELCCASRTSRFRYILELAGVSFPDWSMELGSKNYVFFAGEVGQVGELGLFLWQELLDPVLDADLYRMYSSAWNRRTNRGEMLFSEEDGNRCEELRNKSLEALSSAMVQN